MSNDEQEYDENLTTLLEAVWGEGFLSPGGVAEVDRYIEGIDFTDKQVLDIGCGLGGVDIHLIRQHKAKKIIGIDVDPYLIKRCNVLAKKYNVVANAEFLAVVPGPLAFGDETFDIVTSKDSIIHIPDKHVLAADAFRILRAGGWVVASDWLAGYVTAPSPEMQVYLSAEGLDFGLATAEQYRAALEATGFVDIQLVDRNDWYRQRARQERTQMRESLYDDLLSTVGKSFLEHEIDVWDKMIIALDQGQLRPTHFRGRKPSQ
jgi:SAM-dependent methyltransferase